MTGTTSLAAGSPILEESVEARTVYVPERPMNYEEFVGIFGPKDDIELVNGVPQQRMAAQLDHERLLAFLVRLLGDHVEDNTLGLVLGSRTPVRIGPHLPDLLFIRNENLPRMEQRGLRFAPDLVIEIVSPGDRPSELLALEADYQAIRVPEIVFIDRPRNRIRVVRLEAGDSEEASYTEETLTVATDSLRLESVGNVRLTVSWLLTDTRPSVREVRDGWCATSDAESDLV